MGYLVRGRRFLCREEDEELNRAAEYWRECTEDRGLRICRVKTQGMRCNFEEQERMTEIDIEIDLSVIEEVERFKYLGSTVQSDGNLNHEITRRIQSGWSNWRKCSSLMRDKRVPLRLKSRLQRQVV